jgi:putative hydrolase of the HAD superfamily
MLDPVPEAGSDGSAGGVVAISLDVGGVMTFPDHGLLAYALRRHGVPHDRARFTEAHFRGMAEVELARAEPETFGDYTAGFLKAVGVPPEQLPIGVEALADVLVPPVWCQPVPGAIEAARRLCSLGLRLAVTSNSDGGVEDLLCRHEIVQRGPGPGVEVEVVTDSGTVGVHKPDPKVFQATADGLGLAPAAICHVGDSASFDADGAAAFGMVAVHVDPLGLCDRPHDHVASLAAFADRLADGTPHDLLAVSPRSPRYD